VKLKIKVTPQDFIIEEAATLPLVKKGPFAVYQLSKENWNTVELLHELSRKSDLPYGAFAYGGRKDRHSQSVQYITIKSPRRLEIKEKDHSLKFIGLMQRPMGPDLIEENRFKVTVRKLGPGDIKRCVSEIGVVNAIGFPNYFDDQRFGSFDSRQGFFAQKVLKEQFNGALKIYLTSINPKDSREEKERKGFFFEHWKDWAACLSWAKTIREREAFALLANKPAGFIDVLKKISREELSSYYSSFQAYLWNEILRRIIAPAIEEPYKTYPGVAGDYVFYTQPDQYLEDLILPLPGSKAKMGDKHSEETYHQVLADNGISQPVFNKLKLRQAFFKSLDRRARILPGGLAFTVLDDEIYTGKKKLFLKFSLPRGSYATMLIKRIFS
jgi:tRNA pseudouridine13 synthase